MNKKATILELDPVNRTVTLIFGEEGFVMEAEGIFDTFAEMTNDIPNITEFEEAMIEGIWAGRSN